jgi:Spy/CpxP family protein refolding chaperone
MKTLIVLSACLATGTFSGAAWAAPTTPAERPAALTDAEVADQAAAELMEHHLHHHHGGVTKFIAMSLDTLGVEPAKQTKVDKLQKGLYGCMVPARDLESGLLSTLAEGVAAGTVDTKKADATIEQLDAAATAVHGCTADMLNRLHAVLSPNERATLVDKIQSHWSVWRQVNDKAAPGSHEKGSRLAAFGRELTLTPDQLDKLSMALQTGMASLNGQFDPKKVDAHVQAFCTAFLQKSFDANALAVNASGHLATYGAKRMALFYETATPLLTTEQRSTLAQQLREHAGQQPANSEK